MSTSHDKCPDFNARIALLTARIAQEYEQEYSKRLGEALKACRQLEDEKQALLRKLDLYKRQIAQLFKANDLIKRNASNAKKVLKDREHDSTTGAKPLSELEIIKSLQSVITFISDAANRTTTPPSPGNIVDPVAVNDDVNLAANDVHSCSRGGSLAAFSERDVRTAGPHGEQHHLPRSDGPALQQSQIPQTDARAQATPSKLPATIRSSQSTEDGESLEAIQIKEEPDHDSSPPLIVGTRTVGRSGNTDDRLACQKAHEPRLSRHDGTSSKPFVVKEEPESSPPEITAAQASNRPGESLDLDEVNEHVHTPYKRRRLAQQAHAKIARGQSTRQVHHHGVERASSMPSTVPPAASFSGDFSPRSAKLTFNKSNRAAVDGDLHQGPTRHPIRKEALASMSENGQNILQMRVEPNTSVRKRRRIDPAKEGALGEDGESLPPTSQVLSKDESFEHKSGTTSGSETNRAACKRLEGLLSGSPASHRPSTPSRPRPETAASSKGPDVTLAPHTESARGTVKLGQGEKWFKTSTRTSPSRAKRRLGADVKRSQPPICRSHEARGTERPRSISPSEEPLRARPLEKLKLTDFRINPEFNDGRNFAFAEVVRKQVERRCLPGCTDPRCCGGRFRAMARMGISPRGTGAFKRSFMESTPSQEEPLPEGVANAAELGQLEHFFGSGFQARQRLAAMTAEERGDAVLQATAAALANEHGRHRQRFERAASPDQLWDTDFPSTQKVQQSKEMAHRAEREKVAARHREAVKGKSGRGRFLFRDE